MKIRIPALAIALFGLTLTASGQTTASPRFFLNGTDWNNIAHLTTDADLGTALKFYTFEGVCDGLTALLAQNGSAEFPQNTQAISDLIPHLTNGQILGALDKFYADPKNVDVPLMLALPIIAREAGGATKAQVQTMTETARKIAVDCAAAKTLDDFAVISQKIINNNKTGLPKAK